MNYIQMLIRLEAAEARVKELEVLTEELRADSHEAAKVAGTNAGWAQKAEAEMAWLRAQEPIYQLMDDGKWYDTKRYLYDEAKERGDVARLVYAEPRPAVLERKKLRDLVDVVWSDAAESPSYLSTEWADRLIDQIFPAAPEPRPAVPQGWEACSPEWIERNGECSCAEAPRIAFGNTGAHYHPAVFASGEQQRLVVPEGWKLVPVEPTVDMRRAFHQADEQANDGYHDVVSPDHQWQAMLTAVPDAGEIAE